MIILPLPLLSPSSIFFPFFYILHSISLFLSLFTKSYYYRDRIHTYIHKKKLVSIILPLLPKPKTFKHYRQTTKIKGSKDSALDFYLLNRLSMYVLKYVIFHPSSPHPHPHLHLEYRLSYQKKRVS